MGNKQSKDPSVQTYLDTVDLNTIIQRVTEGVEEGNSAVINKDFREAYIAYRFSTALLQLCIKHEGLSSNIKKALSGYNRNLQYKLQSLQQLVEIERDKLEQSQNSKKKHVPLSKKSLKLPKHIAKELNNPDKDYEKMTEEARAYKRLLDNLEVCCPNLPMSKVIGQEDAIEQLQDELVDRHIRPDLFKKSRNTAALLYGPAGNGKTTIATAIATLVAEASEGNMPYFKVTASNFKSMYTGQAEITLTAAFKLADINGPSIMFIDEVEQLFASRGGGDKRSDTGLVQCFLELMSTYRNVFFIAATNYPWDIDDALLRRMCPTYIRMPTKSDRLQLLHNLFADEDHFLLKKDFETFAERTEGFSFDDICKLKYEVDKAISKITKHSQYFKQTPPIEGRQVSWTPCMEYEEGAIKRTYRSFVNKRNKEGLVHPSITMAVIDHAFSLKKKTVEKETIELNDMFFQQGKEGVKELLKGQDKKAN